MPSLVEVTIQQGLESPMTITCERCGIIFYRGATSKFLSDTQVPMVLDYLLFSIRHAWDYDAHRIVTELGGMDCGALVGDDVNHRIEVQKMDLRNRGLWEIVEGTFDNYWEKQISNVVGCSICRSPFHNIKEAAYCCEYSKIPFRFPFDVIDDYPRRK